MTEPNNGERPTRAEMRKTIETLESRHAADQRRRAADEDRYVTDQILIAELRSDLKVELDKIANLEIALVTARRIGTAMGILMDRLKVTEDAAFGLLRDESQHTHRKVRDIAEYVLETGTLPERTD